MYPGFVSRHSDLHAVLLCRGLFTLKLSGCDEGRGLIVTAIDIKRLQLVSLIDGQIGFPFLSSVLSISNLSFQRMSSIGVHLSFKRAGDSWESLFILFDR